MTMELPTSRLEQYLDDLYYVAKINDDSQHQRLELEKEYSCSTPPKRRKRLSDRLASLHRDGTMKISMARMMSLDSDKTRSDARNVTPTDPTERQLNLYTQGVSKLRDELWTSKNRSESCFESYPTPQNATERQLSMYNVGVSKFRNNLLAINDSDKNPKDIAIINSNSRANADVGVRALEVCLNKIVAQHLKAASNDLYRERVQCRTNELNSKCTMGGESNKRNVNIFHISNEVEIAIEQDGVRIVESAIKQY